MNDLSFDRPVPIFVGLGFPTSINNVHDAYRILCDWDGRRGPAHEAAMNACRAAFQGDVDGETVRGIFSAFAKAHCIVVPDAVAAAELASATAVHG